MSEWRRKEARCDSRRRLQIYTESPVGGPRLGGGRASGGQARHPRLSPARKMRAARGKERRARHAAMELGARADRSADRHVNGLDLLFTGFLSDRYVFFFSRRGGGWILFEAKCTYGWRELTRGWWMRFDLSWVFHFDGTVIIRVNGLGDVSQLIADTWIHRVWCLA